MTYVPMTYIHILNDSGTLFWGINTQSTANRLYSHTCWRKEPMKLNHWYGNNKVLVKITPCVGQVGELLYIYDAMIKIDDEWVQQPTSEIHLAKNMFLRCFSLHSQRWFSMIKHRQQMLCERNAIRNRLIEYHFAPVAPDWKGMKDFKQRWAA